MSSMTNMRRDDVMADDSRFAAVSGSGIAWAPIIGGAVAAAAVSLILLLLGSALGLSSLSPWSHPDPESVASFTVKTAIWIIIMQWIASGLGGYVTGRLRTKWVGLHSDEVFFRDTAHGFLAWAVATLLTASVLASAATSVANGGVHAMAMAASGTMASGANQPAPPPHPPAPPIDTNGYYIDSLFRSAAANPNAPAPDVRAEVTRILMMDMKNGTVPDDDKTYLAQLVSARTGLNNADASKRVGDVIANLSAARGKAKEDAEAARKAAMHISLYIFLSLLIGAFIASTAAAIGGRQRDEY